MISRTLLVIFIILVSGCGDRIDNYKIVDRSIPHQLDDLPHILRLPNGREDLARWHQVGGELVGKDIDDAIQVLGNNYLLSLWKGRSEPRMYYHLAGTHAWGIFGVLVLDDKLQVVGVTTDPAN